MVHGRPDGELGSYAGTLAARARGRLWGHGSDPGPYRALRLPCGLLRGDTGEHGVPLPGETILLASGVLAQQGHLGVEDAIVFGILGAVVGDQLGYWAGREGGRPFVLKWGRYVFISPERLTRAEAF